MEPRSTFEKAQRKKRVRRLGEFVKQEDTQELLPLGEVTSRLRLFQQSYVGIRDIPIDKIVGTVDRGRDFDRELLPRRPELADRWKRVEQAFPQGGFPPIVVYQVNDSYFVVDGHHRVAIAKQRGATLIEAEVTRIKTRFPLPADADLGRLIALEQERAFMEESALERARPDARIDLTRPYGYQQLLEQVKVHGYNLMQERGELLTPDEVAADWYDQVYVPTVDAIRSDGLAELIPHARTGDLYLWVHERRREMVPERGGLSIQDSVREGRKALERRRKPSRTRQAAGKLKRAAKRPIKAMKSPGPDRA